jgi:hypothetical protein
MWRAYSIDISDPSGCRIWFGLDLLGRTQTHNAITYTNTATYATANTHSGNGQ